MLESGSKIINGCGFGKDYNLKGNVIFEGEYFKCKRWNGKGKIYNNKTKIMFDVEYKEGKIKHLKNKKPIKIIPKNYHRKNNSFIFKALPDSYIRKY